MPIKMIQCDPNSLYHGVVPIIHQVNSLSCKQISQNVSLHKRAGAGLDGVIDNEKGEDDPDDDYANSQPTNIPNHDNQSGEHRITVEQYLQSQGHPYPQVFLEEMPTVHQTSSGTRQKQTYPNTLFPSNTLDVDED